jgi:LacI family gluconate utilization system Gnt-I transcriptional repressor
MVAVSFLGLVGVQTTETPPRRSRRSTGAVTLRDIARLADVAPITASRAINTPEQVSEDVRRRVAEAIAKTGYVPNLLAGGLASSRSRLVAAVVPTVTGPVFSPTIDALTESLAQRGYQLMLGQTGYGGDREEALLEAIIGRRPDGIVLTGIVHPPEGRRRLIAAGIPVVETWDLTSTPIDMLVGFSHAEVGRAVARYLHARGRRRLAVVAGSDERARRRFDAFAETARELGVEDVRAVLVPAPTTLRSGRDGLAQLLAEPRAVDAVWGGSDLLALGVLTEAQTRGLRVPDDLAVVGFGDIEFAADMSPALTSVHIDAATIGHRAADFIVTRAEGGSVEPSVVDIGFSIAERESS